MERYSHVSQCILICFLYFCVVIVFTFMHQRSDFFPFIFVLWLYLLLCINVILSTVEWTLETNARVYYVYMCLLNFEMNFRDRLTWKFCWRFPNVWECILYVYYIVHNMFTQLSSELQRHTRIYIIYTCLYWTFKWISDIDSPGTLGCKVCTCMRMYSVFMLLYILMCLLNCRVNFRDRRIATADGKVYTWVSMYLWCILHYIYMCSLSCQVSLRDELTKTPDGKVYTWLWVYLCNSAPKKYIRTNIYKCIRTHLSIETCVYDMI